tara:strand:+ start:16 stop:519 length:504 start_codon:yes stop_codon:yes gene_type:complete
MKQFLIAFTLVLSLASFAQVSVPENALTAAAEEMSALKEEQRIQKSRLYFVEGKFLTMQSELMALTSSQESTAEQVASTLERLAQSERAINTTLDSFQLKFEQQNKTIDEVQGMLNSKMDQMMTFLVGGILVALILVVMLTRLSTAKALRNHSADWNSFQEHILKSK